MRYMLLIYTDENVYGRMSEAEMQADMAAWWEYTGAIKGAGASSLGDALQPTSTATTVTLEGGDALVTDGPFAETREQLGGFYLLDVREPRRRRSSGRRSAPGRPTARSSCARSRSSIRADRDGSQPRGRRGRTDVPGRVRPRGGDPRARARRGRRPRRGGRAGRLRRRAGPLAARRRAVHPGGVDPHHRQAPRDRPAAARGGAARQAGAAGARAGGGGARPARRGRRR